MMDTIKAWLVGISCCAILISVLKGLMPEGPVKKASGLVCGVILLLVTVKPLLTLDLSTLSAYKIEYQDRLGAYSTSLADTNERLARIIIEERSAAYILDKATAMGADIQVEVTVRRGDGAYWYPYSVTISGTYTEQQQEELRDAVEAELAVPEERQNWSE